MSQRFNYAKAAPGVYDAMDALDQHIARTSLNERLCHLVRLRASQINGCGYCIDMHWKDLKALGEAEQRLYGLDAWRESPYYSEEERAALAWTESVTLMAGDRIPDPLYNEVRAKFSENDLAELTMVIATINAWNRLSVAARLTPGRYQSSLTTGR